MDLVAQLGSVDIYLLDQVLRGTIPPNARILDAGCGRGRNLPWFINQGHSVSALDSDAEAVLATRDLAGSLGHPSSEDHFRTESIESTSFNPESFDFVICNAVLHFADDPDHFQSMVASLHRLLRPRGLCFARLASTIGLDADLRPATTSAAERWFLMPDGSERFLVDLDYLLETTRNLPADLTDPIKTVNVQNRRCMTTWVWKKPAGP